MIVSLLQLPESVQSDLMAADTLGNRALQVVPQEVQVNAVLLGLL